MERLLVRARQTAVVDAKRRRRVERALPMAALVRRGAIEQSPQRTVGVGAEQGALQLRRDRQSRENVSHRPLENGVEQRAEACEKRLSPDLFVAERLGNDFAKPRADRRDQHELRMRALVEAGQAPERCPATDGVTTE